MKRVHAILAVWTCLAPAGCVTQWAPRERTVIKPMNGTVDVDKLFSSQVTPEKRHQIEQAILSGGLGHPNAPQRVTAQADRIPPPAQPVMQAQRYMPPGATQPMPPVMQAQAYVQPAPGYLPVSAHEPVENSAITPWMGGPKCEAVSNNAWAPVNRQEPPPPEPVRQTSMPMQQVVYQAAPPPPLPDSVLQNSQQVANQAAPPLPEPVQQAMPMQQVVHQAVPEPVQPVTQQAAPIAPPPPIIAPSQTGFASAEPDRTGGDVPTRPPEGTASTGHFAATGDRMSPPPIPRRPQGMAVPAATAAPPGLRPKVKLKGTAGKPGAGMIAILEIEGAGVRFMREGESLNVQGPQGPTHIMVQKISRDAVFVDVGNASEVLR